MKKIILNLLIFLLMIAIGIGAAQLLKKNKKAITHDASVMESKPVDVMTVRKQAFSAHVTAYGHIEPSIVLQGKAELSGKVSYIHPELEPGGSIAKGTVVVRIDPDDYQFSLKQTEADLISSRASLDQLKQEQLSTSRSLKLANDNLRFGLQELKRVQGIWQKRLISRSALDQEEQKVIQLRQSVSDFEGKLATYRSRLNSAKANISRSKEQVKGKETTLGRTEIRMPFDARISSVNVQEGQFTPVGGTLFEAIDTKGVEVNAAIPIRQMSVLLSSLKGKTVTLDPSNMNKTIQSLQLQAQVSLIGGNEKAVWQGRIVRFSESIDPVRRTIGITIAIDNPYENVIIGQRPPLLKGMYVAVEISAPAYDAIVIPRHAVHLGRAYVLDSNQQLAIRALQIRSAQAETVVVEQGLEEGDQLIINDLIPVIEGMPLVAIPSSTHPDSKPTEQPTELPIEQSTEQPKSKQGAE